ncbi:MAG: patatin-like phospholipase family protein [Flavobacteriales bacterium]|nr:patatin-like phospholipase family protein [Flavobacteriales bacterium]MDP4716871.1 patatin-like phospholipase family protein [Flavobacteriales bacterium]MDP4731106.1 patatin-like phospholipase family protein [Flavobacteriales bacterium]MDP4818895.1 patatin-like phospholipase family protein [Flavobacteriales bacterium]MDP4951044.1 patatin-like phospholipase family protein [Flavobacteriales bacterium]
MKFLRLALVFLVVFMQMRKASAQRVGVVLSGGGATAMAHIGFLKALEENNVPIDYICGTSMGAVIASFYAAGYSTRQMDSLCRTPEFTMLSEGAELPIDLQFYYLKSEPTASMVSLKYSGGDNISNTLPTNLINPALMDWVHMKLLSAASEAARQNFDSLFVPFRCVAADVKDKREVIFKSGSLNEAIRASCTYPFYIPPRRVDGKLLYDGGIYNNFPIDVMYRDFHPDVILGCNVSGIPADPKENNLMSQLEAMIVSQKEVFIPCEEVFIVQPNSNNTATFEFANSMAAIDSGYVSTLRSLPEIKKIIEREISAQELRSRRVQFRSKCAPIVVDEVRIEGLPKGQTQYVRELLGRKENALPLNELQRTYFRVLADGSIKSIYPKMYYKPSEGKYVLDLQVQREKDLIVSFGGNFSSRSINTGYVGLRYNLFGRVNTVLEANSYFGRYYGSVQAKARSKIMLFNLPVAFEVSFTQNRWDYYKSLTTFFEDVKPSYVLLNERFGEASWILPAGRKAKFKIDAIYTHQYDNYYQTKNFLSIDTADLTEFNAKMVRFNYVRSTLNRIQYATSGSQIKVVGKGVAGTEYTIPGSTSINRDTLSNSHSWLQMRVYYENYIISQPRFSFGIKAEVLWSGQKDFQNATATSIMSPTPSFFPEFRTFYLPVYRGTSFFTVGISPVLHLTKNIDLRADVYGYQPFQATAVPSSDIYRTYTLGSGTLVYHSPIGPVSLSANYYEQKENPWSILFNLGFIISNPSPRD